MATKPLTLRIERPHFGTVGRFQLFNVQTSWVTPNEWIDAGWVSIHVALLGFSASLTWWRA